MIPFGLGYKKVVWNFLEAAHGKGAPDGVGGTLKRTADRLVAQGRDLSNAAGLYRALLSETNVKLFYIEEEMFEIMNHRIKQFHVMNTLPKAMKIHQIILEDESDLVKHKVVSCYCDRNNCTCFGLEVSELKINKHVHEGRVDDPPAGPRNESLSQQRSGSNSEIEKSWT
jgi:hypothetical protein